MSDIFFFFRLIGFPVASENLRLRHFATPQKRVMNSTTILFFSDGRATLSLR